ncbi:beta-carotene 3-hydroxylase 2, chloroplastic [Manihot esculenta]|uniref:Uncharacterized protein n=1 Tax=Manihot esculenta TaxID=3983 RepID=A0ACB7I260_MANES|nr:beta-carotene 3-hydroxylase 2, chloroplastic [Manihot esculenta]KAG8659132.1 hypothetical protein MANES_02G018300v8 [Manihot esculenta]
MAVSVSATSISLRHNFCRGFLLTPKPNNSLTIPSIFLRKGFALREKQSFKACMVMEEKPNHVLDEDEKDMIVESFEDVKKHPSVSSVEVKRARKMLERYTYLAAAILSSAGITSMAAMAVYYRFSWQIQGGEFPALEMLGTFVLSVGAAVGMEFWAKWAHKALWHASLWQIHESHHRAREGSLELNDVFAVTNAAPAIGLLWYGFWNKGLSGGLCFGAGLGITVFGMAYMFVHDGLIHRRFPVGPIAYFPYLQRVAAAHQLHHSDKFKGVPYGLFLGPKELEGTEGGMEALDRELQRRIKLCK